MKRNLIYHHTISDSARLDPAQVGFCFGGFKFSTMTQLNLFDQPEEKPKIDIVYVLHHKSTGMADFDTFLELNRDFDNTFVNNIYLSEIDEVGIVKQMLFKFDKDLQDWVHKPVYNFRINHMLHFIYDYLSEKSNHV